MIDRKEQVRFGPSDAQRFGMIEVSKLVALQPVFAGAPSHTEVGAEAAGAWVGLFAMELLALLAPPSEPARDPLPDQAEHLVQIEEQGDCDDPGPGAASREPHAPLRETNRDAPTWRALETGSVTPREAALPERAAPVGAALIATPTERSGRLAAFASVESEAEPSDQPPPTAAPTREDERPTPPSVSIPSAHSGSAQAPAVEEKPPETAFTAFHEEPRIRRAGARPQVFHSPSVENPKGGAETTPPEDLAPSHDGPQPAADRVPTETAEDASEDRAQPPRRRADWRSLDIPRESESSSIQPHYRVNIDYEEIYSNRLEKNSLETVNGTFSKERSDAVALARPSRELNRSDTVEARAGAIAPDARRPFSPAREMPEAWRQTLRVAEPIPQALDEADTLVSDAPSTGFPQVRREAQAVVGWRFEPRPSASRPLAKGQTAGEQPDPEPDRPAVRSELLPAPRPDRAPAPPRGLLDLGRELDDGGAEFDRLPLTESDRPEAPPRQRSNGEQPAAAKTPERQSEARGPERPAPLSPTPLTSTPLTSTPLSSKAGTTQIDAEPPAPTEHQAARAPLQQPGASTMTGSVPVGGEQPSRQSAASAPPVLVERAVQVAAAQVSRAGEATRLTVVVEDDRLGSVALRLAERHGRVEVVLRTDNPATARQFQSSLPQLYENLLQRGLQPELRSWTPIAGADPERREGDRRQQRERDDRPQGRDRSGHNRPAFAIPSA